MNKFNHIPKYSFLTKVYFLTWYQRHWRIVEYTCYRNLSSRNRPVILHCIFQASISEWEKRLCSLFLPQKTCEGRSLLTSPYNTGGGSCHLIILVVADLCLKQKLMEAALYSPQNWWRQHSTYLTNPVSWKLHPLA